MKIYNLRVQLVKHAGNDMRLQFLKLLPPSIRLDCSGYSLVFPRTKPYLNTNKIRQIHAVLVLKEALWLPESAMPGLHLSYQSVKKLHLA